MLAFLFPKMTNGKQLEVVSRSLLAIASQPYAALNLGFFNLEEQNCT